MVSLKVFMGAISSTKPNTNIFLIYSHDHKFVVFCFALLLPQILDKFQNQKFWNLLVLTISNFKTSPTCPIWSSFGWGIGGSTQMIPYFYFHEIGFVGDEINRNLNNLFQRFFCLPSKVPISTRIILRNTSKMSGMFYQLLSTQNVQISIIFLSVKSIVIRIKK